MRNILAIADKELRSYFASPIAYIMIGLFSLLYVGVFLWNLPRTFNADDSRQFFARCVRGWAVVLFSYGCTSNMVEQPLMNIVIGLCFGAVMIVFPSAQTASAPARAAEAA